MLAMIRAHSWLPTLVRADTQLIVEFDAHHQVQRVSARAAFTGP